MMTNPAATDRRTDAELLGAFVRGGDRARRATRERKVAAMHHEATVSEQELPSADHHLLRRFLDEALSWLGERDRAVEDAVRSSVGLLVWSGYGLIDAATGDEGSQTSKAFDFYGFKASTKRHFPG